MAVRARKPAAKKKAPAQTQATRHARKQMWAVVLFACGILLGALTWIKGDKLWFVLHEFLFGMFGWSAFFFAPLMIYISVIAALDKPLSTIKNKLWQLLALSLMISGAFQIFGSGLPDEGSFIEDIKSLYSQGIELKGGGMTSLFVAMPLMGLFEKKGASIIIVLCICVFAMLLTGSSLLSLFKMLTRPVKGIENAYAESFEDRQTRKEAKAAQKAAQKAAKKASFAAKSAEVPAANPARFDYDVDISKDTDAGEDDGIAPWDEEPANPDLPGHPVVSAKPGMPEQSSLSSRERLLGIESPVEYISPGEFAKQAEPEQERQPTRRHSLDDDILRAEQETDDEIGNIIDRFISTGLDERYTASGDEAAALINASVGNDADYPDDYERPVDFASADQVNQAIPIPPSYISGPDSLQTENPEPEFSGMMQEQNAGAAPVTTIPAFADPPNENRPPYIYKKPSVALLSIPKAPRGEDITGELNATAEKLVETLQSFGVQTRVIDKCRGPAVTRYELQPSAGVKISKITGLADDIALNLASAGIRIEAPIPNKAAVGIEVPNKVISMVSIREILDSREFQDAQSSVSVALGKDIAGNITLADIGKMPHLLIAGSTGSGKSVCINSIIISLLYRSSPDDVKLLMVDPKVVELGVYNGIPHLLVPVVTDPKKAAGALNWAVVEMLRRYKEFADHSVRDLAGYNRLAETSGDIVPMPKIVIIIDELADLMMAAPNEVEDAICRLAQMARAAGMHLVIATQRPSVDVITGVIKANIPSRIAFAVSSMVDSRTILDMGGAEKLLGRGDMLFYPVGASKPQRVQGCFVTDVEVEKVVEFIKSGENTQYDQQIVEEIDRHVVQEKSSSKDSGGGFDDDDDMLPQAIECVVDAGMASTSQLQRRLKLGYARAARIIDQLEERGIVGPFEGSKPRQVLISRERWMEMKLSGAEDTQIKQSQG